MKKLSISPCWIWLLASAMFAIQLHAQTTLIPNNATWRYLDTGVNLGTTWTGIGFNDAAWSSGPAELGYGDGDEATVISFGGNSNNKYVTTYFRHTINIANPSSYGYLTGTLTYDDGAVVYINGQEVFRVNMPDGTPTYTTFATGANDYQPADIPPFAADMLVAGNNVVAVEIHQGNATSSDVSFALQLFGNAPDPTPPTISQILPAAGSMLDMLSSVTVTFSEPVTGVNAGDLLINGFPANAMSGGPQSYTFDFFQPPFGLVAINWNPNHGIVDLAFPPNAFDSTAPGASWQYQLVDDVPPVVSRISPPEGTVIRSLSQIDVQFSEIVVGVDASDLLINGQPATGLTALPGGFFTFAFDQPVTGQVQVAWAANTGIQDQADVPNAFGGGNWSYTLDPNAPAPDLVLNEIMTANESGLTDETGEMQDWIEIWNRGGSAIDLEGYALSDDPDVPGKWVFPSRVLGPNEYLVVFASSRDIKNPVGNNRLHANFQLSNMGEHVGLYSPDNPRVPLPGVFGDYPEQRNDHSYGLDPEGDLRYFAVPTPGSANGPSDIIGVVEPVHFSVNRGYFTQPFTLHLSSESHGADIYYTTDGSIPSAANGRPYLAPLQIADTTLVRAVAQLPDHLPSRVATHSFFFNLSDGARSLPLISIVTDQRHLTGPTGIMGINGGSGPPNNVWAPTDPSDTNQYHNPQASLGDNGPLWERPTSVEWLLPDNSGFQVDCGIRVHGSDWTRPRYTADDKFAFRLYFKGDYGPGRLEFPWFPNSVDDQLDEVVLRAGHNDISNPFITDELIRRLHADMGQAASHGTFGNLLINGELVSSRHGANNFYYNPVNRIKEGFLQAWHGGGEDWDVITPFGGLSGDGDRQAWNEMESYIRNQSDTTSEDWYLGVQERLDLVNFVDYLLVNIYGSTWDWPHNNWRAARERVSNGIFRFYVWDAEGAFYIHSTRTSVNPPHNHNIFNGDGAGNDASDLLNTDEIATFYRQLRGNPEFRLLFADRIHKHFNNGGSLTETNITTRFNQMRTTLSGVFNMNLRIINEWVPGRRAALWTQFMQQELLAPLDPPAFSQHGGRIPAGFMLSMTAPSGTIFYTLDGSDPRQTFSGNIAAGAQSYASTGPVALNGTVLVKARARNGANWSALTEAVFEVGSLRPPVRITEIMYDPIGDYNAHEFLEIQNLGSSPVNVSAWSVGGVDYTFPNDTVLDAGAVIVLSSDVDPAAFALRYPGVVVFDRFTGALNNGGEELHLLDAHGHLVHSVNYDNGGTWPASPQGRGYSLEIIDPLGAPDEPANWRASLNLNGSPGASNPPQPAAAVVIHELMAENLTAVPNDGTYPDWLELHNTTGSPVNLAGWSLTDDDNPRQFVFPAGTTIAANGYLIVWCDDLGTPTPGIHTGFALGRNGETVRLFDNATNRVDAVTYGLQLADSSIGRIGSSWTLNIPTPNAANAAASLAPASELSLNEWQANPFPGEEDWIELYNKSSTLPVALTGIYLKSNDDVHQITSLSYVAPNGFVQLIADEEPGPDHLDFRLPASGSIVRLFAPDASQIEGVSYTNMPEGTSRGRLPDGQPPITAFITTPSPGASNFLPTYSGPVINEFMARNDSALTNSQGAAADWVEFRNPAASPYDMSLMSLSVNKVQPGQWLIPSGTTIPANGHLVVWFDGNAPATTNAGAFLNAGRSLAGQSGAIYLFNPNGQQVDAVAYGPQIQNRSVGLIASNWALQETPTPNAPNSAAAALGTPANLRINEWLANANGEDDWFELYNLDTLPVALAGLWLTDDPSQAGATNHVIANLSFVGGRDFVRFEASNNPGQGANHVGFNLNGAGELIRLYAADLTILDQVSFGAQFQGVSQGRLPDGSANIASFPFTPSPERSNYLPTDVVINEILTHTDPPLEDAVELLNLGSAEINIGGWYLSDNRRDFRKYRIPDNTILAPGERIVFYEFQFNDGSPQAFALNSARGGTLWLSAAGGGGSLTGRRHAAEFGAAENGVSFGRHVTSLSQEFVAMSQRTFGADSPASLAEFRTGTGLPNAAPKVGPIVINEIMYHPVDLVDGAGSFDNSRDEFVELLNISAETVPLYDPLNPQNVWTVRGGIDLDFPANTSLAAGESILLVNFDPDIDTDALAAFRAAYPSLPINVDLFGPYGGQLGNGSDEIRLFKPDRPQGPGSPDAGYVPQILVDHVHYTDTVPWPAGDVDGGGLSLQKEISSRYGNDPLHWVADIPTPGQTNGDGIAARPVITASPVDQSAFPANSVTFTVIATGEAPLSYQWRFQGRPLAGENSSNLTIDRVVIPDDGDYDVIVSNAGGSAVSEPARLRVTAPPVIVDPPQNYIVSPGSTVTFTVTASGPAPLSYQWFKDGLLLSGATSSFLELMDVQGIDSGNYTVAVSNPNATVSASGNLNVLVAPTVVHPLTPYDARVVQGGNLTLSVSVTNVASRPVYFRWRRGFSNISTNFNAPTLQLTNVFIEDSVTSFLTMPNVQPSGAFNSHVISVIISNMAFFPTLFDIHTNALLTVLTDTDGDLMPDEWELDNGFEIGNPNDASADTDNDGVSNKAEYESGTDPRDPNSYLRVESLELSGSGVALRFRVEAGHTYSVQYKDGLTGGSWSSLLDLPVQNISREVEAIDTSELILGPRIYRLVTPKQ